MEKKPRDPAEAKGSGTAKTVPPRVKSGFEADPLHPDAAAREEALSAAIRESTKDVIRTTAKRNAKPTNKSERENPAPGQPDAVGYGRPPRANQFKPGQSGNRSGRPKGAKNYKSLLFEQLNRTISIHQGGKTEKCTVREALLRRCIDMALKGDLKALMFLLNNDEKSAIAHAAKEVRLITGDESPQEAAAIFAAMLNGD